MAVVETSLNFLKRDELYEHEKPYQLKYAAAEGIPISNLRLEKQDNIKITSIRDREAQFSFEKNGFAVLRMNEEISYDDLSNPGGIRRYLDIVSGNLKNLLGADKVQASQYVVRLELRLLPFPLTVRRSVNAIQASPPQNRAKIMNSINRRRSLTLVCILRASEAACYWPCEMKRGSHRYQTRLREKPCPPFAKGTAIRVNFHQIHGIKLSSQPLQFLLLELTKILITS